MIIVAKNKSIHRTPVHKCPHFWYSFCTGPVIGLAMSYKGYPYRVDWRAWAWGCLWHFIALATLIATFAYWKG
jgi:hypothetical protein